jgi:hypothetical protein
LIPTDFELGFPLGRFYIARGALRSMHQTHNSLVPAAEDRVMTALQEILEAPEWHRRAVRRVSYFGPVAVGLPDTKMVEISAFARDISAGGIGLVHLMPLHQGEVVVTLPLPSGPSIRLLAEIRWCRDYGNGWYASGAQFVDVLS